MKVPHWIKRAVLFVLLVMLGRQLSTAEITEQAVTSLLQREVVAALTPLEEVQRYCDSRVPPMPRVESAAGWLREAQRLRDTVLEQIVYRGKAAAWRDAATRVEWLEALPGGKGYRIRKLRFEAVPGMWIPALLYEPVPLAGKVPAILNLNGHSAEGKAYNPKQIRCINQARRGMLALNVEWVGMGQLRTPGFNHASMNQLDLCGAAGLAPHYLLMKRSLDILLSLEHTDPERLAVTGLSGGGWQTIFISALDTRVKLAVPVAGYSSYLTRTHHLKDLGDSEQTPNDLATLVDYTHLTAMMAPRPTLLIYNAADNCCFEAGYALGPLLTAAHPLFCLCGRAGSLRSHVNYDPGTHNYERDNRQALYRMLGDVFYAGDPAFDSREIPSDDELKTAEELSVELPEKNENFNTLALQLAASLPAAPEPPAAMDAAEQWRDAARWRLAGIVRAQVYQAAAEQWTAEVSRDLTAHLVRLKMDAEWTVPATVLSPVRPQKTALVIADEGRASAGKALAALLAEGWRTVALDPFCFGESFPAPEQPNKGSLYALTAAAVGGRPLGIQASQVAAASRWAAREYAGGPVRLVCLGPRTSLIGLIAAGLERDAIGSVELHESLGSLKQVIEENWSAREKPEVFCYGLLAAFDIRHLAALTAPRECRFAEAGARVQQELAGLQSREDGRRIEIVPARSGQIAAPAGAAGYGGN